MAPVSVPLVSLGGALIRGGGHLLPLRVGSTMAFEVPDLGISLPVAANGEAWVEDGLVLLKPISEGWCGFSVRGMNFYEVALGLSPEMPEIIYPPEGSLIIESEFDVGISDFGINTPDLVLEDVTVEVSKDPQFSTEGIVGTFSSTVTKIHISGLEPGVTYYLRARTRALLLT